MFHAKLSEDMVAVKNKWFLLIAGVFVISLLCIAGQTKPGSKVTALKFGLAFKLNFYNVNARPFFVKEDPFTLYVTHDFKELTKEGSKFYRGKMLMEFKDDSLVITGKGLGVRPRKNSLLGGADKGFMDTVRLGRYTAVDLFPLKGSGEVTSAKIAAHIPISINGNTTDILTKITINRPKPYESLVVVKFLEDSDNTELTKDNTRLFGEYSYKPDLPGIPWVYALDLNDDGILEILVGQESWRNYDLYVFSTTPEKFKGLAKLDTTILNFGDYSWPCKGTEIFKKGKVTKIKLN